MYGIVEIAGHQYKVKAGDMVDVQKLTGTEEGSTVEFDKVLFVSGETPLVGLPTVEGATVKAKLIRHDKSRKIIIFKRRPGTYRRKNGHRQEYSALLITDITDGQGNTSSIDSASKAAKKHL